MQYQTNVQDLTKAINYANKWLSTMNKEIRYLLESNHKNANQDRLEGLWKEAKILIEHIHALKESRKKLL